MPPRVVEVGEASYSVSRSTRVVRAADPSSVCTGGSVAGWGVVAQVGMSAVVVVVVFPVTDDHAGLGQ